MVVGYTGVIRQDLTVDPEDPRFQAFSVGFGVDFDAAETQATTINQRFSSRNDGSGYEVLLRDTWGVAEGVVTAGASERGFSSPDGPICTGSASSKGCWAEISNHPGCYLWNPGPREGFSANWSGECSGGFAEGRGEVGWQWNDGSAIESGLLQGGKREGTWTIFWAEPGDDKVVREVGSYVSGERHGTWTGYDASGNVVGTLRYENGRLVSGSAAPVVLEQSSEASVQRQTSVQAQEHFTIDGL